MPLYEYRCTQCGNRYEKIQTFSSEPDTVCPKCGGQVERPLTAPALQFKGAGWYINDYAPKAAGGSSSTEKPADSAASSDSKTADSKPTATEAKPAGTESTKVTPSSSSSTT